MLFFQYFLCFFRSVYRAISQGDTKDANRHPERMTHSLYPQNLSIFDSLHVYQFHRVEDLMKQMILFDLKRSLFGEAFLSKIPHSSNSLPVSHPVAHLWCIYSNPRWNSITTPPEAVAIQ